MDVYWGGLAPVIALAITLAAMQLAVVLTRTIRSRDYRRFEDQSRDELVRRFPIPGADRSPAEERLKALSWFVDRAHQVANAKQTTYHNAVARAAGCLTLAFVVLAVHTVPPQGWPLKTSSLADPHAVLAWVDVIAILFVLFLFLYGGMANRRWIADRAAAELLRQYQFLSVIFPSARSETQVDDVKSRFEVEADLVKTRVQDGWVSDIAMRIEGFWSERKASIAECGLAGSDISPDALLMYLQRRARRQLSWFADSNSRLRHIAARRNILLLSLYCIAAGLAVAQLAFPLFYREHPPVYLPPLLLIVTGMSAAMTAYYINQNARSLIHRYSTQQRRLTEWLEAFNDRWKFDTLPSMKIAAAAKDEMRDRILQFEDLMIEEIVDWVHVTSHDAIELAP